VRKSNIFYFLWVVHKLMGTFCYGLPYGLALQCFSYLIANILMLWTTLWQTLRLLSGKAKLTGYGLWSCPVARLPTCHAISAPSSSTSWTNIYCTNKAVLQLNALRLISVLSNTVSLPQILFVKGFFYSKTSVFQWVIPDLNRFIKMVLMFISLNSRS